MFSSFSVMLTKALIGAVASVIFKSGAVNSPINVCRAYRCSADKVFSVSPAVLASCALQFFFCRHRLWWVTCGLAFPHRDTKAGVLTVAEKFPFSAHSTAFPYLLKTTPPASMPQVPCFVSKDSTFRPLRAAGRDCGWVW